MTLNYSINQNNKIVIVKNNSNSKNYCNLINYTLKKIVKKFDVLPNNSKKIFLEETGYYYIKMSDNEYIEDSNAFLYISNEDKNKLIKQLDCFNNENIIKDEIEYFKIPGTNQNDFCLINYNKENLLNFSNLNKFIQNNNYKIDNINKHFDNTNLLIYSNDEKQYGMMDNTIF